MSGFNTDPFARLRLEDNGVFPVRVIDIQATLVASSITGGVVFIEPTDWQFHTISHTWSLHIRKLSEEIGRSVVGMSTLSCSYNEAFRRAKLHQQPGYAHLLEFLAMIQADGVEKVWCDALCINQVDDCEKSREIIHMGSFYFHSLGCYTVAHGFGRGFGLTTHAELHDDDHEQQSSSIARWFSRVWTLQEWLLPRRLTFVVELDKSYIHTIVKQVRTLHEFGECECRSRESGEGGLWLWGWRDRYSASSGAASKIDRAVEAGDEEEFWKMLEKSGYKCLGGRFQKFTADSEFRRGSDQASLYWVERIPYMLLLDFMEPKNDSVYEFLITCDAVYNGGGYPGIVRAISSRNCSYGHDEDRVLSVLALLGLDGKLQQLRAGQSLGQQIVQMADAMAVWNLEGLITLCAAFFEPYPSPLRLSWAPHFQARPGSIGTYYALEQGRLHHASFHHTVAEVRVSSGGLSLSCYMLKGRLLPYPKHAQDCTSGGQFFNPKLCCYTCRSTEPRSSLSFALEIASCAGHAFGFRRELSNNMLVLAANDDVRSASDFHLGSYFQGRMIFDIDLALFGAAFGPYILPSAIQFNVWLLLLGTYQKGQQERGTRTVLAFMVCVGARDNFQKVGIVHVLPTYTHHNVNGERGQTSTLNLDSLERVFCTIGGFSKEDWTKWTLEQMNTSPWWNYN